MSSVRLPYSHVSHTHTLVVRPQVGSSWHLRDRDRSEEEEEEDEEEDEDDDEEAGRQSERVS